MGHWTQLVHREACSSCNGLGRVRHGQDVDGREIWWECSSCDGTREIDVKESVWVDDEVSLADDTPIATLHEVSTNDADAERLRWTTAFGDVSHGGSVESTPRDVAVGPGRDLDLPEYRGVGVRDSVHGPRTDQERFELSLAKHGVWPEFVPLHFHVWAEAQAAWEMDYEQWRSRLSSGALAEIGAYVRGECAEELLEAIVERTIGHGSYAGAVIDVASALQSIADQGRWNEPDDDKRYAYRVQAMYTLIMSQVADELTGRRQPARNRLLLALLDQQRRFELWAATPDTDRRLWPQEGDRYPTWRAAPPSRR